MYSPDNWEPQKDGLPLPGCPRHPPLCIHRISDWRKPVLICWHGMENECICRPPPPTSAGAEPWKRFVEVHCACMPVKSRRGLTRFPRAPTSWPQYTTEADCDRPSAAMAFTLDVRVRDFADVGRGRIELITKRARFSHLPR